MNDAPKRKRSRGLRVRDAVFAALAAAIATVLVAAAAKGLDVSLRVDEAHSFRA
jgi:hypothetical protein